jgi:Dual OB-containing domain
VRTERIVCLANSYKHDNRCVAGISLVTKKWVRLIGKQVAGCLTVKETCYADGKPAALLDVFEAELGESCGTNCHPEDVFITGEVWRPVRRFDEPRDARFLADYLNKGPSVLQGWGDRVYARKFEDTPVDKSLDLIHPEDLWWWIREENGKRKNRALFRLGHVVRARYDLAVTDPVWLDMLNLLPAGIHPHTFISKDKAAKTFLTMSLSEPFEGFHYKLVAGVINLPS